MLRSVVVLIVALAATPAWAWNGVGHRAVAEIAWRNMDEKERAQATELLKKHPHYEALLTVDVPPGKDTNEWAFLNAAVWPDVVRPAKPGQPSKPSFITKYNLYPHGTEIPFLRAGDKNKHLLKAFPVAKTNAQGVLSMAISTLRDRKATDHDRAVSLCLVLHLCGDTHQPLHMSALVTPEKPKGYGLGGGLVAIEPGGIQVNLHTFWDMLPGSDLSYEGVSDLANKLSTSPEFQRSALWELKKHRTVSSWAKESFQSGTEFAYAPGNIQFVDVALVNSRRIPASDVPRMTEDYASEAKKVAYRRLALAANRLTDLLKKTW